MDKKTEKYFVCEFSQLKQTGAYGWDGIVNNTPVACFLILQGDKIYSYINRCPHTGVNLDWLPHQFLDSQNAFIQCATHGALFNIEDGECIHGPCLGDKLIPVQNTVEEEKIYLVL